MKKTPIIMFINNDKNVDKFDLFVKIHRFFGLTYYGYYESEKKLNFLFYFIYQIIVCSFILYLCSPCLINKFNCKSKISFEAKSFRQLIIS